MMVERNGGAYGSKNPSFRHFILPLSSLHVATPANR
jgi:hypothetical protein